MYRLEYSYCLIIIIVIIVVIITIIIIAIKVITIIILIIIIIIIFFIIIIINTIIIIYSIISIIKYNLEPNLRTSWFSHLSSENYLPIRPTNLIENSKTVMKSKCETELKIKLHHS